MTTAPLRITLVDDSDLAAAGLRTLLAPYADRVAVVDNRDALAAPDAIDVVLYEPMGQTSMSRSLLRDLQAMSAAQAAVFSWAGPDQLPATPANPHLAKSLTASQIVVSVERLVEGRFESAPGQPPHRGRRGRRARGRRARRRRRDDDRDYDATRRRPHPARGRDRRSDRLGPQQPRDRRAPRAQHQLGQDLHPQRVPQDGRRATHPGSPVGPRQRHRRRAARTRSSG